MVRDTFDFVVIAASITMIFLTVVGVFGPGGF